MIVPFRYNFRGLSTKFPTIQVKLNFHISSPRLGYFFLQKRKPKIFEFENLRVRGVRKILTFVKR